MLRRVRSRLTYANVVASAALFIALGGVGVAAVSLPRNSVGSTQIRSGAVTSAKVKDGSLLRRDFRTADLPVGPAGAAGAAGRDGTNGRDGAPGAAGSAKAYAVLRPADCPAGSGLGPCTLRKSRGFASARRAGTSGEYCLTPEPGIDPQSIVIATVDYFGTAAPSTEGRVIPNEATADHHRVCDDGEVEVLTARTDAGSDNSVAFALALL